MTQASRSNRGSTKETMRTDWRTPPPLHAALQAHYQVTTVLDLAASQGNALALRYLTEADNTLTMSLAQLEAAFEDGVRLAQERTVHPIRNPAAWLNPPYLNSQQLLDWVRVLTRFSQTCRVSALLLVPASRSEQDWWHEAIRFDPQLGSLVDRTAYYHPDGTPSEGANHPSCCLAFNCPRAGTSQITSIPQPWQAEVIRKMRIARNRKAEK